MKALVGAFTKEKALLGDFSRHCGETSQRSVVSSWILMFEDPVTMLARYIVVVHPFKLVGFLSRSKCRVAVFSLWFLAWVLSVPVIFSTVTTHSQICAVELMYRIL